MLVGADDSRIHIYTQDKFNLVLSLEGHENWIQSLDVIHKDKETLMIASASEDCYIRIWKIVSKAAEEEKATESFSKVDEATFNTLKGHTYSVSVESILSGHENWIYSVQWYKPQNASLQILSTSMDKTMIIWEADSESNIWTEKEEVHRRHSLLSLNKSLLQKLVILNISRSSDKDYIEKLNDSEEANEWTLKKLLDNIAMIEDECHKASNKNLASLNTLKEEIKLKKDSLAELKALFMESKEKVALSSVNSETGKHFSTKDVKELLSREKELSKSLEEYQLHSIEKRHYLNIALEKKKNLAEGPIDFAKYEMMCIETQNNKEIIQPISEEIKTIMKKVSSIINILSHLGQKSYQIQKEQTKASNAVEELEKELSEMRDHLFAEKIKFTKMKHENKELKNKFVLLQHPRLIEDYTTMQQRNEEACKEVETLKKVYAKEMQIIRKKLKS